MSHSSGVRRYWLEFVGDSPRDDLGICRISVASAEPAPDEPPAEQWYDRWVERRGAVAAAGPRHPDPDLSETTQRLGVPANLTIRDWAD